MDEETLKLTGAPVVTAEQAEAVRLIRNQCRHYMTRHQANISADQQLSWWLTLDKRSHKLFIFRVVEHPLAGVQAISDVGFGLCRLMAGKWWVTGGLANEWQGKGLGKALFGFLVEQTGLPCWLEAQEHNIRAVNTYIGLGFQEESRDAGIITMVKR